MADLASVLANVAGDNDEAIGVRNWLSTGFPPLDEALSGKYFGGGMPSGRIIEMFGPESSGKTAIATQTMIHAQKEGGVAIFMDHERSFDHAIAEQQGLRVGKGEPFVFKTPDTFEESTTNVIKICQGIRDAKVIPVEAPIAVVFDSLASMVPKSKFAKDIDEQGMNDSLALAKACSAVMPTLAVFAEKLNICMLFLNQEREKPGVMFGDPITTPGGRAPKFYASVRIQIGRTMIKKQVNGKKRPIGQEVKCKVIKNKVHRPFEEAAWKFMFREDGTGYFDVTGSLIDHLEELDILKKSGNYYVWDDGKKYLRDALVKKIDESGEQQKLLDMLPK